MWNLCNGPNWLIIIVLARSHDTADADRARRRRDRIGRYLLRLLTAAPGTKRTFYACRRRSVLGGRAVVQRTSPQRPILTHSGHRLARNPAAQQSPAVPRYAILLVGSNRRPQRPRL